MVVIICFPMASVGGFWGLLVGVGLGFGFGLWFEADDCGSGFRGVVWWFPGRAGFVCCWCNMLFSGFGGLAVVGS